MMLSPASVRSSQSAVFAALLSPIATGLMSMCDVCSPLPVRAVARCSSERGEARPPADRMLRLHWRQWWRGMLLLPDLHPHAYACLLPSVPPCLQRSRVFSCSSEADGSAQTHHSSPHRTVDAVTLLCAPAPIREKRRGEGRRACERWRMREWRHRQQQL